MNRNQRQLGAILMVCLAALSGGCEVPIEPKVNVQQVNVQLCLALVERSGGVVEELVECDAGSSVPVDAP